MMTPMYSSIPLMMKSTVLEAERYVNIEYIEISIPTKNIATLNNTILKAAMKSPTVRLLFLLTVIANTSVPSITAPPRIESPIPDPRKKPPNTEIKRLSSVISGILIKWTNIDRATIAKMLLIANSREICLAQTTIKGRLIMIIR